MEGAVCRNQTYQAGSIPAVFRQRAIVSLLHPNGFPPDSIGGIMGHAYPQQGARANGAQAPQSK
jgi:hypothetical protein